ncbi:hypothetical protein [Methylobacterium sp. E-045]|uniref:hypothetical protein n=1 Tax=Methylobacterium sp. E-045 TaxID=2836575 RepID=UPI001FBA4DA8|nr:hypothetical protein [Methylobacterium sp. E-045]MCJ2130824.1 hypothetical protein [Methylobacterium sp. E-045]
MIDLLVLPILGAASYALCRRSRTASAERAGMLRPCEELLAEPVHGRDPTGFGTLGGRFLDLPVEIRVIPEALAFRRLPQLWLSVSVHHATGVRGTVDVLRRVVGAEFYAPADSLPARYDVPEGWPGETLVRGSPGAGPILDRACAAVATILAEPRVKEVLLTPRGIRIVSQLCQGDRGAYLLLRENRFPVTRIGPEQLRPLLARATDLVRSLTGEGTVHGSDDTCARAAA